MRVLLSLYEQISPILFCFFAFAKYFSPKLKQRWLFEQEYKPHPKNVDFVFEVSSEGELEQILPFAMQLIKKQYQLLIFYCSPSVQNKVKKLEDQFPCVYVRPLPLVRYCSWGWPGESFKLDVKQSTLILCRYDFFPHLIKLGLKAKRFCLFSATLKNKNKNFLNFWPYKVYSFFDIVVTSTYKDSCLFSSLVKERASVIFYDFRVKQILLRQSSEQQKSIFKDAKKNVLCLVNQYRGDQKIIFGSFWQNEVEIFQNMDLKELVLHKKVTLFIFPHKLNPDSVSALVKSINSIFKQDICTVYGQKMFQNTQLEKIYGVVIVTLPGILCEMYTHFNLAYVGGGFGRSVHSLLEPFLAGCQIVCGPKTHRSSEYDLILESKPQVINCASNLNETATILVKRISEMQNNETIQLELSDIKMPKENEKLLYHWLEVRC